MTRLIAHTAIIAFMLAAWAFGQAPQPRDLDALNKRSRAAEAVGLKEPFKGITANGQVEPNLFAIRSTGVSTEPVRKAAAAFSRP